MKTLHYLFTFCTILICYSPTSKAQWIEIDDRPSLDKEQTYKAIAMCWGYSLVNYDKYSDVLDSWRKFVDTKKDKSYEIKESYKDGQNYISRVGRSYNEKITKNCELLLYFLQELDKNKKDKGVNSATDLAVNTTISIFEEQKGKI